MKKLLLTLAIIWILGLGIIHFILPPLPEVRSTPAPVPAHIHFR